MATRRSLGRVKVRPVTGKRTRTFEWDDPSISADAARKLSGLDVLRAIVAGEIPAPPIAALMGASLTEVEHGRAVFELDPAEWMYNPIGAVHGGIAATLLDSAMGCAVHSTLAAGVGYTTTDLQVRYVRGMGLDTGPVRAEASVVHAGRRLVTAQGQIVAVGSGKLIAHATTACMVLS
jgi:uncharacterized protein (TIGR00369 family)